MATAKKGAAKKSRSKKSSKESRSKKKQPLKKVALRKQPLRKAEKNKEITFRVIVKSRATGTFLFPLSPVTSLFFFPPNNVIFCTWSGHANSL